jgi:RNA polymerase sigma-70 factor (ECF subfamily)
LLALGRSGLSDKGDQELLAYFHQTQDTQAIAILMERYNGLIYGMAMRWLKDSERVNDFAGDLYIKMYEYLQKNQVDNFSAWLGRTVRNRLHDLKRKDKVREDYASQPQLSMHQTEAKMNWELDHQALQQAMGNLSEVEQTVIRGVYFEEKSYYEIGDEQSWTFNQVRGARERAIRKLKAALKNDFENYFKD